MKVIKNFNAYSSHVELVEISGIQYVLKTADLEEINNEREFLRTLRLNGLPSIDLYNNANIESNQLLMEYIVDSKPAIIENAQSFQKWGQAMRKMHDIHFPESFRILSDGTKEIVAWSTFLKQL